MIPSRLPAVKLVQNLPSLKNQVKEHNLINYMIGGNLAIFGAYMFASGPKQERVKSELTVTPGSRFTSIVTFHGVHTSVMPLLVNCGALATLGMYHYKTLGQLSFLRLFGLGCAFSSLAVMASRAVHPDQRYAGHIGASAALLSYHAFRQSMGAFKFIPYPLNILSPMALVGSTLLYALYCEDKAVIGGLGAGYLAFLLCL